MKISDLNKNFTRGYKNEINAYERGRPSYPADAFNYLTTTLNINECTTILDLGAGSGKFTRLLDHTMAHIIAVEPVPAMRTAFKKNFPNIEIISGNAESIPLENNSIDVIVCAQAFH